MSIVLGIDEVGRGCWAGPLVAGAVVLGDAIAGLADSKVLTKRCREALAAEIQVSALAHGLGWVTPAEVDELGLTAAVSLAMRRAATAAIGQLTPGQLKHLQIIIDGNYNFLPELPNSSALIKADASIPAVSAASILAKVARDAFMTEQSAKFPQYGFDKHVGYGTALHIQALMNHGVCELHRLSYKPIQKIHATLAK